MPTTILTKKRFLKWIEKQIADDDAIIINSHIKKCEVKTKTNEKLVTIGFAADCWKQTDGVNDIVVGRTPVFAVGILPPEFCHQTTLDLIDKQNEK